MAECIIVLTVSTAFLRMLNLDKSDQLSNSYHTPAGFVRIFVSLFFKRNVHSMRYTDMHMPNLSQLLLYMNGVYKTACWILYVPTD